MANQLTLAGSPISAKPALNTYRGQVKRGFVFHLNAAQSVATSTTRTNVIQIPPNFYCTGGALNVGTAFDSSGSATVAVGSASSGTAYLAQTSIKSAAQTALTTLPPLSSSAQYVSITQVAPAGATVGDLIVFVDGYYAEGEDFSQGDDVETNI